MYTRPVEPMRSVASSRGGSHGKSATQKGGRFQAQAVLAGLAPFVSQTNRRPVGLTVTAFLHGVSRVWNLAD